MIHTAGTVALMFAINVYKQHSNHGYNAVTFRFIQNVHCFMYVTCLQSSCGPCALPVLQDHSRKHNDGRGFHSKHWSHIELATNLERCTQDM